MPRNLSHRWAALPRLLYTHNPLYLISAVLVLYGMHRAVAAEASAAGGPLLMEWLCGYTLLLAVVGYLIIRFGQVWEDARTILLLLVLLFVALFGRIRSDHAGRSADGSEIPRRGLGIRRGGFRGCFVEPADPPLRALSRALLLALDRVVLRSDPAGPAFGERARRAGRVDGVLVSDRDGRGAVVLAAGGPPRRSAGSGQWHALELALVSVVAVCRAAVRDCDPHGFVGLAFESGHRLDSSFRPYFWLPLLLAGAVLLLELAITAGHARLRSIALALPAGLLLFALPGGGSNQAAAFTAKLSATIASPAQLTLYGLIAFYAVAWLRKLRWAELGCIFCLFLAAVVNRQTFDLGSLTGPQWPPLLIVAAIELGLGIWRRASWRLMIGIMSAELAAIAVGWDSGLLPPSSFYAWHGGVLALLLLAAMCNDAWARRMRRYAWPLIPLTAAWVAIVGGVCYPEVPAWIRGAYLIGLAALGALYWLREPAWRRLGGAAVACEALATANLRWLYAALEESRLAKGLPWLAWGMGALAFAVCLSLYKGGAFAKLHAALRPSPIEPPAPNTTGPPTTAASRADPPSPRSSARCGRSRLLPRANEAIAAIAKRQKNGRHDNCIQPGGKREH